MKLTYVGPFDRVRVPLPYGGEVEVNQGEKVEVPDSLGRVLLEQQANWAFELAKPAKAKGGDD